MFNKALFWIFVWFLKTWKKSSPLSEIYLQLHIRNQYTEIRIIILFFVLFAIFILHSRESELYRYTLDGKSALAWELPFSRFMGQLHVLRNPC